MKLNKILFAAALASVIGGSMTSCSESFLDEDLKTNTAQTVSRRRKSGRIGDRCLSETEIQIQLHLGYRMP